MEDTVNLPSDPAPETVAPVVPQRVAVRRRRTTGKLLGRDLPQSPPGGKRVWGRACRSIDVLLDEEHRADFERLLADPRTTGRSAQAWLAGRGVRVSRGAVDRYRKLYDADTAAVRRTVRVAAAYARAAEAAGGGEQMSAAAVTMIELLVVERLLRAATAAGGNRPAAVDDKTLRELARILSASVVTRQRLLAVQKALGPTRSRKHKPTGEELANRMRQIMGLKVQWKSGSAPPTFEEWARHVEKTR